MKSIRIFIASSEELSQERIYIGALVCRLEKLFQDEGLSLELLEWEDFDSAYNGIRKQDEYNRRIVESDLFFALFWTRFGQYTAEEYRIAREANLNKGRPAIKVFIKKNNEMCPALNDFICTEIDENLVSVHEFTNVDSLKCLFIASILKEFPLQSAHYTVSNERLMLGNIRIADIRNIDEGLCEYLSLPHSS